MFFINADNQDKQNVSKIAYKPDCQQNTNETLWRI